MGRKSNPITSKHFSRGDKIQDASNRYQYTCRHCGEHFPKGRLETLYGHVTQRCTALSTTEKRNVVLHIREIDLAAAAAAAAKNQSTPKLSRGTGQPGPSPHNQDCARLNALAEVSGRRQGTQTSYATPSSMRKGANVGPTVLDPALQNQGLSATLVNGVQNGDAAGHGISPSGLADSAAIPSERNLVGHPAGSVKTAAPQFNVFQFSTTRATPATSLTSIAASASASLAHNAIYKLSNSMPENTSSMTSYPITSSLTQQVSSQSPPTTASDETNDVLHDGKLVEQRMAIVRPRPIAIKPYNPAKKLSLESSQELLQERSTQGPKVRAAFNETRKQEVKKMREIGSCIRCRFLRKTCSTTTPCGKCAVLESPRNWKDFPCTREKLVNMYQGYMLGLYENIYSQDTNAAKSSIDFVSSRGRLLVRYFDNTGTFELRPLEGATKNLTIDPPLSVLSNGRGTAPKTLIVDDEANDLPIIFEQYILNEAARFVGHEASPVIKIIALYLYRSLQGSEDELLYDVIKLWIATKMLSGSTTVWRISVLHDLPQGSLCLSYDDTPTAIPLNAQTDRHSYALISSQLQCGLERLASKLSTHALNKFEKRMSRNITSNHFETFLVAILLINCIERHSQILHSWTDPSKATKWPIKQSTSKLLRQAETATKVIAFVAKIRNLRPKVTGEGAGDVLKAEHAHDNEKYAQFFKEISVTSAYLVQRQNGVFDVGNFCSLDLKFSATLLVPADIGVS